MTTTEQLGDQKFLPGTKVDLFDVGMDQWRGVYTVIRYSKELVVIENVKTRSKQHVKQENLRNNRLPEFWVNV